MNTTTAANEIKIIKANRVYSVKAETAEEANAILDAAFAKATFGIPVGGKGFMSLLCECVKSGKPSAKSGLPKCQCTKCGWTVRL